MTDLNAAKFMINGTPSDAYGYIALYGEQLELTLETDPSTALSVRYEVYSQDESSSPLSSKNAPVLTFEESETYDCVLGDPNATATLTMPANDGFAHSWIIRATATTTHGPDVYERIAAIQTDYTTPAIRKTIPAETSQFEIRGFSDTLNDMVDALKNLGGGGGSFQYLAMNGGTHWTDYAILYPGEGIGLMEEGGHHGITIQNDGVLSIVHGSGDPAVGNITFSNNPGIGIVQDGQDFEFSNLGVLSIVEGSHTPATGAIGFAASGSVGISQDGNLFTFSATDTTYTNGNGISIVDNVITNTAMGTMLHGSLIDLTGAVGHHPYYLDLAGTRTMTGHLLMGTQNISGIRTASFGSAFSAASYNSGTITVDWTVGQFHAVPITGNVTSVTFSNPPVGCGIFTLEVTTDASARTITGFPASVIWMGGINPNDSALEIPENSRAIFQLIRDAGNSNYRASVTMRFGDYPVDPGTYDDVNCVYRNGSRTITGDHDWCGYSISGLTELSSALTAESSLTLTSTFLDGTDKLSGNLIIQSYGDDDSILNSLTLSRETGEGVRLYSETDTGVYNVLLLQNEGGAYLQSVHGNVLTTISAIKDYGIWMGVIDDSAYIGNVYVDIDGSIDIVSYTGALTFEDVYLTNSTHWYYGMPFALSITEINDCYLLAENTDASLLGLILAAADAASVGSTHNSLSSIQGGNTTERYHLTAAQHGGLTGITEGMILYGSATAGVATGNTGKLFFNATSAGKLGINQAAPACGIHVGSSYAANMPIPNSNDIYAVGRIEAHDTIWADEGFCDRYKPVSWSLAGLPLSSAAENWTAAEAAFGEVSLLEMLVAAYNHGGSGCSLDDAYRYNFPEYSNVITVDEYALAFQVPDAAGITCLRIENLDDENTDDHLIIHNESLSSTDIYFSGAAGNGYDVFGHRLWSDGALTIGRGTGGGDDTRRAYTAYEDSYPSAVHTACAIMRAEANADWDVYSYVKCSAGNYGYVAGKVEIGSTSFVSIDAPSGISLNSAGGIDFNTCSAKYLKSISFGTGPTVPTFSSGIIAANFSTGKTYQEIDVTANVTGVTLTAPSGVAHCHLTVNNTSTSAKTITGFSGSPKWFGDYDPNTSAYSIPAAKSVDFDLRWNGSKWSITVIPQL